MSDESGFIGSNVPMSFVCVLGTNWNVGTNLSFFKKGMGMGMQGAPGSFSVFFLVKGAIHHVSNESLGGSTVATGSR